MRGYIINNKSWSKKAVFFLFLSFFFAGILKAQLPKVYLVNPERLVNLRKAITEGDTNVSAKLKVLTRQADKLLNKQFKSIMDKNYELPGESKHNYISLARYYWPDSSKPDGKPYIRKDGEKNPEVDSISDDKNLGVIIQAVNTLSYAYYFTGNEKYAAKCAELLRFWFLDTATKMNPNLEHAQMVLGKHDGGGSGIIDTHLLPKVIDGIGLLTGSPSLTKEIEEGMVKWFRDYINWLQASKNGKHESQAKNNHGSFYEMQVAAGAMFTGQYDLADKILKGEFARIASQVEPDGKQPFELVRTLGLGYSSFNLEALFMLANIAEKRNIDLWNYQTADGRSIRKALDYLVPFALGKKTWEHQQIHPFKPETIYSLLAEASIKYNDESYKKEAETIRGLNEKIIVKLLYE